MPGAGFIRYTNPMSRPNKIMFPRPMEARPLLALAQRFNQTILDAADQPLHIIGVTDTGTPIAAAIATHCAQMRPGIEVWLSIINVNAPKNTIHSPQPSTFGKLKTIVVDNAINTGLTMRRALQILAEKPIPVDMVVKMIDYQDDEDRRVGKS